jgi:virulence-associated protein VagC
METLLIVAVVLTALAIIVQAGVLVSMYLMSRKLSNKTQLLMDDSRRIMTPVQGITNNVKLMSDDFTVTGKKAQQELHRLIDTVSEARSVVMRPVRQYSAMASAIAEGLKTFFASHETGDVKVKTEEVNIETEIIRETDRPAA